MDSYKVIQEAKDVASQRGKTMTELKGTDVIVKMEYPDGSERYYGEFKDYHGPEAENKSSN